MHMLTRRLQVLIDDDRYERLRREAERTGAPIGAIVREAIDAALPAGRDPESIEAAGRQLLEAEPMPVGDWSEMKGAMLDELYGAAKGTGR
jgi:hypothetical protein